MKPILLKLQAFGAFKDEIELDFRKFEKQALFLIHGNIGSGKTTLFDAITFALYGETTQRDYRSLYSNHSSENEKAIVELVFKHQHRFYQVHREFWKKNKRNEESNSIEFSDKVSFQEVDKAFQAQDKPLTKKKEVEKKVSELLGFSAQQFKQIIILPQGKFQDLLLADTKDKEAILKQLFEVEKYEKIVHQLKNQAQEARKELNNLESQFANKQQDIQERIQSQFQEIIETPTLESFATFLKKQEEEIEKLKNNLDLIEKEEKTQKQALENLERRKLDFETLKRIQQQQAEHQSQEAKQKERIAQLEQIQKAKTLENSLQIWAKQKIVLEDFLVQEKLLSSIANWEAKISNLQSQKKEPQQVDKWKIAKSNLEKLEDSFEELQKLESQKNEALKQEKLESQNLEQLQKKQGSLEKQKETVLQEIEQQKETAKALEELLPKQIKIEQWQKERKIYQDCFQEVTHLKPIIQEKLSDLKQAIENTQKSENQWLVNQAAELALDLKENPEKPCPVCGSTEHLHLAEFEGEVTSKAEIETFKKQQEQAQKEYDKVKNALVVQEKTLANLKENAAKNDLEVYEYSQERFDKAISSFNQKFSNAQKAQTKLKSLQEKTLPEIDKNSEILRKQIDEQKEKINQIKQSFTKIESDHQNKKSLLPHDIESVKDLKKQIQTLEKQIQQAETLQTFFTQYSTWKENEKQLLEDAQNKGFDTLKILQSFLKTEKEEQQLKTVIENWQNQKITLQVQVQTASEKVKEQTQPSNKEILKVQMAHKQVSELLEKYKTQITTQETHWQSLNQDFKKLQKINENLHQLEQKSGAVLRLSRLASGENDWNQTFTTYVLSVFLDEVLKFANQRLEILSQGRFELFRTGEKIISRGRQSVKGLDLKVFDSYTGAEMFVQNLSGGETFLASLSLALGLADVAMARSGGLQLGAMFIDEGFGSLDNESLELAIQTLMNLEGQHRLVGLISHVAEMKELAIPKLEVVKGKNGSHLDY